MPQAWFGLASDARRVANRLVESNPQVRLMPTTQQIPDIVARVRQRLAEGEQRGIHLKVISEKLWLYIVVVPSRPGVRASEYANFMSMIERELRARAMTRCCWCMSCRIDAATACGLAVRGQGDAIHLTLRA
jgi:hypothetical protein